jgi:ATP-dependent DNA ligase
MPGAHGVDSIIVGYYKESQLIYVARVRNGFAPADSQANLQEVTAVSVPNCPFANLPETHKGRWGTGLTADDMKKCVWVRPTLLAQIEYLEWTESDHLRDAKFIGLRGDKGAADVVKEHGAVPLSS